MREVVTARPLPLSPAARRLAGRVAFAAALVGLLLGIGTLVLHLTSDPLADTRVYYDAGARLNAGLPLYDSEATGSAGLYLYPPLLGILFRPLALLPFSVAAMIWQAIVVGAFALALQRAGIRKGVLMAVGCLALPILWALSIGQAEPLITLLLATASPASIALAGHLKLVPWLAAVYWVGRRDVRSLVRFTIWVLAIGIVQLVLEPAGTLAYLRLTWLRPAFAVRNISPYAIHPLLWVAMVAGLAVLALRYAPSRHGWALAVVLAVLAYPRLLTYQLMSLLAAFGGPPQNRDAGE